MRIALAMLLLFTSAACSRERTSEIWIGGDVHVGDDANGGLDPLLALFDGAPLFANIEGPVTTLSSDGKLSNAPDAIDDLAPPLTVAGIENNHALDFGPRSRSATVGAMSSFAIPAMNGPTTLRVGRTRWIFTQHDVPAGGPPPKSLESDLRTARTLATRGDVMVAAFHSTGPELYLPPPEIRDAVELAVREGADVVAVHGSHVVGPVERRGDTFIAWGLGNLLFRCDCTRQKEGLLLHVVKRGDALDVDVVPIEAGLGGAPARLSPTPDTALDLLDAISPAPLVRSSLRDARTGRLPAHQAPEYQR